MSIDSLNVDALENLDSLNGSAETKVSALDHLSVNALFTSVLKSRTLQDIEVQPPTQQPQVLTRYKIRGKASKWAILFIPVNKDYNLFVLREGVKKPISCRLDR